MRTRWTSSWLVRPIARESGDGLTLHGVAIIVNTPCSDTLRRLSLLCRNLRGGPVRGFFLAATLQCAALAGCALPTSAPPAPAVVEVPAPAEQEAAPERSASVTVENWLPAPRAPAPRHIETKRAAPALPVTIKLTVAVSHEPAHRRRGGCGSRGGAGYRLANGRCAGRRRH